MAASEPYRREPPTGGEWDLDALRRVLWQRRWLVAAIALEVLLVGAVVTFLRTPLYEASARLIIEKTMPRVLDSEDVVSAPVGFFDTERFYQTQYLLMRDPAVLERALDNDGLRELLLAALRPEDEEDLAAWEPPDDGDLVEMLGKGLDVAPLEKSNVVRVSYRHRDPEIAARIVNAVVRAYRDFFVESGTDARRGASEFLDRRIEDAQAELLELERRLAEERRRLGPVLARGSDEMGSERLVALDQALTEAKRERAAAEARVEALDGAEPLSIEAVRSDPLVVRLREELASREQRLEELRTRFGPDWPEVRELSRAIAEARVRLAERAAAVFEEAVGAARADLELARTREARLQALFQQELAATDALQRRAQDYDRLYREYEQKRQVLDRLLARREEIGIAKDLRSILERQVSVVAPATPPERPAVPRYRLDLALSALLGLFLGIGAAFAAEALDNKVRSVEQLGELGGLPVLGSVPHVEGPPRPRLVFSRKRREGASPVVAPGAHSVEEAFRTLRSSLLLSHPGGPPRVLMVTSALPGEGKSTFSANLARTLAAFGDRVVLLDADLRHPRLHRAFKAPRDRGLANVLAGATGLDDVLFETRYDNLALVPGGPCPPDPATLLDPERVRAVVRALRERHGAEFVIVDTPPTLVFADAYSIVPAIEGVILVARALRTPKDAVREVCEALRKIKAPLLGAVLNDEAGDDASGSYYRYRHYKRGYYAKARAAAKEDRERSAS
ncbi:MAG: exopolysaccharide regulatory tyrosine autokinase VpsO [Acidobacteriota bacterium]